MGEMVYENPFDQLCAATRGVMTAQKRLRNSKVTLEPHKKGTQKLRVNIHADAATLRVKPGPFHLEVSTRDMKVLRDFLVWCYGPAREWEEGE